jgi:hypothetical protein
MADRDLFESRLATALQRLAAEASKDVDPERLARSIASTHPRRTWWRAGLGTPSLRLTRPLRLGLAVVPLVAVTVAALIVGQQTRSFPTGQTITGQFTCAGSPWTAFQSGPRVLDCRVDLSNDQLDGTVRISLDVMTQDGVVTDTGTIELHARSTTWVGNLSLTIARNGLANGDATVVGEWDYRGVAIDLHLITADGLNWGVIGTTRAAP